MQVIELQATESQARSVSIAASLLDEVLPDWENNVNLNTLDIADLANCVLGQLYNNSYSIGINNINRYLNENDMMFNGYWAFDPMDVEESEIFGALWADEIKDRLRRN